MSGGAHHAWVLHGSGTHAQAGLLVCWRVFCRGRQVPQPRAELRLVPRCHQLRRLHRYVCRGRMSWRLGRCAAWKQAWLPASAAQSTSRLPSWLRAPPANTVHPLPPKLPQADASRSMGCASTCPAARLASPAASERMLQVKSTACTLPQRHRRAVSSMCCKAHTPSSCRMLCTYEQCWAPTSLLTPHPPPTHTLQHLQQQQERLRPLPGQL